MKAKISIFGICVEGIIYLLRYSLHDRTFKYARFFFAFNYCWTPAPVEVSYEVCSVHSFVRNARSQDWLVSFPHLLHEVRKKVFWKKKKKSSLESGGLRMRFWGIVTKIWFIQMFVFLFEYESTNETS